LLIFLLLQFVGAQVAETLDRDVQALKEWLRAAWCRLADPSMTAFDRREIRNYMKEAEIALGAGLRRIGLREKARQQDERGVSNHRRMDFRILRLVA
jgi:hypothetical protein